MDLKAMIIVRIFTPLIGFYFGVEQRMSIESIQRKTIEEDVKLFANLL